MESKKVRIPDGDIFGFMEHGADPDEQVVAEAQSCIGDPCSYERALEWERTRKPVVRQTDRPIMTLIAEALGSEDRTMSGYKPANKPRSENRQRTNLVAVRFTDSERAVLAEAAACTGKGGSTLLRETFLEHANFIIQMAAAKAAEPGRRARIEESERHPSCCIAHRRRVTWIPAPGWWIHADNQTCSSMWNARAPEGAR